MTAPRPLNEALAVPGPPLVRRPSLLWVRFVATPGYAGQTDFLTWCAPTQTLAMGQGSHLYDLPAQDAIRAALIAPYQYTQGGLVYHHWPVLDGLLLPVAGWPLGAALAACVLVGAVTFTLALRLLVRGLRFPPADGWLFGLAAWRFLPHIVDLEQGQASDLLCLPLAGGLLALRAGAEWQAGPAWP